jgi:hypothetical protein
MNYITFFAVNLKGKMKHSILYSCDPHSAALTMKHQQAFETLEWCRVNLCTPDGKRICMLCGHEPQDPGETVAVGIFIAHEKYQKRLGAPAGKQRLVVYVLCEDCFSRPDRNERVEDKILATVSVQ